MNSRFHFTSRFRRFILLKHFFIIRKEEREGKKKARERKKKTFLQEFIIPRRAYTVCIGPLSPQEENYEGMEIERERERKIRKNLQARMQRHDPVKIDRGFCLLVIASRTITGAVGLHKIS